MHLLDEVPQHALGGVEVCDDAVFERTDRHDVAGRATDHLLGFRADGEDSPGRLVDRHNGRLVQHDTAAADVDEGVGGTKVDGHVTANERHVAHEDSSRNGEAGVSGSGYPGNHGLPKRRRKLAMTGA